MMMFPQLLERVAEISKLSGDVLALYSDIAKDGNLDTAENLTTIVDFVNTKSELLSTYVSAHEVLLVVCGVLGILHPGDTSDMYLKIIQKLEG